MSFLFKESMMVFFLLLLICSHDGIHSYNAGFNGYTLSSAHVFTWIACC